MKSSQRNLQNLKKYREKRNKFGKIEKWRKMERLYLTRPPTQFEKIEGAYRGPSRASRPLQHPLDTRLSTYSSSTCHRGEKGENPGQKGSLCWLKTTPDLAGIGSLFDQGALLFLSGLCHNSQLISIVA